MIPFYREGNQGLERLGNLTKAIEPSRETEGNPEPMSTPLHLFACYLQFSKFHVVSYLNQGNTYVPLQLSQVP